MNKRTFKEALESIPGFRYASCIPIVKMRPRAKQKYDVYPVDSIKKINQATDEIQIVSNTRNLVGYDMGLKYRSEYFIDSYDLGNPVSIIISDNISHITSSFVIGMFEDSVDYFDSYEEFFEHYRFDCNNTIFLSILNGVRRIYLNKEKDKNNDNL